MTISRKMFMGRISIPNNVATSLYACMRDSPLHWGYETTALTTPSLDSINGSECGIIPDGVIYIGSDATLNAGNGVRVAAGANFSLQDFGPGIIDPNVIYLFSVNGSGADLSFTAR